MAAAALSAAPLSPRIERARTVLRWLLAAAFFYVGCVHIARPGFFLQIVPAWVPYPRQTVLVTGACEIAGAIGLLIPRLRWLAGVMLALYAVCVFPANIKHALDYARYGTGGLGWWYHGPRMPAQALIIWWCLFAGKVIDWPFGRRQPKP